VLTRLLSRKEILSRGSHKEGELGGRSRVGEERKVGTNLYTGEKQFNKAVSGTGKELISLARKGRESADS